MAENQFETITAKRLHEMITAKESFFLVDTLTNGHFQNVHLPGAENACVFEVTFPAQMGDITDEKTARIVLYGAGGTAKDAEIAAEKLERMGYGDIVIYPGGIDEWREKGLPLEGDAPEAVDESDQTFRFEDGTYTVDTGASRVEWAGRNANGKHFGVIGLSGGEVMVNHGNIAGSFDVDMTTIQNVDMAGDPLETVLIDHLRSDDFFFTEMFPTATFTIKKADRIDDATQTETNFGIEGDLTVRGVSKSIRFPATLNRLSDGGFAAEAHFDIDRTRWGIIYGSARFFKHLGMHKVYDTISFDIRLVFN